MLGGWPAQACAALPLSGFFISFSVPVARTEGCLEHGVDGGVGKRRYFVVVEALLGGPQPRDGMLMMMMMLLFNRVMASDQIRKQAFSMQYKIK